LSALLQTLNNQSNNQPKHIYVVLCHHCYDANKSQMEDMIKR